MGGLPAAEIGRLAKQHGLELHELTPQKPSLEEAFMALTANSVEYHDATSATHTSEESSR